VSAPRALLLPLAVFALAAAGAWIVGAGARSHPTVDGEVDGARYRLTAVAAREARVARLPPPGPLRFAAGIAPGDEQVVREAIASSRPEARRLVELVAGIVTIRLGRPDDDVAGQMRRTAGGYEVVLDLGGVYRSAGLRGVRRLVLHELAHVVDSALVPSGLERRLDAATPAGVGCENGLGGGCAVREERFAESFAKWASGDIGDGLYLGYSVPPPTSMSAWGAPLAALMR
jgi:hypothetical protein